MIINEKLPTLLNLVIQNSLLFDELLDKTDFDSWSIEELKNKKIINDTENKSNSILKISSRNKERLEGYCFDLKAKGIKEYQNDESLPKFLTFYFFDSKSKRLEAKIDPTKEILLYGEAVNSLQFALGYLQDSERVKNFKKTNLKKQYWEILFYNELSICFAGLKNSSISRGYAEEVIGIIKKDKSYTQFLRIYRDSKLDLENLNKTNFILFNLYNLFLTAIFNKAESERRSHLLLEAERDFRVIKDYSEKLQLFKYNYYSAILNLGIVLIDQSRGRESIDLFNKIINDSKKNDLRHWKAHLEKINSMIDQAEYYEAERYLVKIFLKVKKGKYSLKNKHKYTHEGFDALNCFARCQIEKARNAYKLNEEDVKKLELSKKILEDNIDRMEKREQKQSVIDAYKNLGTIYNLFDNADEAIKKFYKLLDNANEAIKKFLLYLSKGYTSDLKVFSEEFVQKDWINECEESDTLEKILYLIYKDKNNSRNDSTKKILRAIGEKIEELCEEKSDLSKIGKIKKIINEVINRNDQDFISRITEKVGELRSAQEGNNLSNNTGERLLTEEEIRRRLDFNEKKFDKVLFGDRNSTVSHLGEVVILRRWNSFSPGLFRKDAKGSLGGGYLVRINKKDLKIDEGDNIENIVIDPGYNFIQNFCGERFSITDIDTIIVTHSHLDHCANLLPIMDLLYQINKRYTRWDKNAKKRTEKKRVTLVLSRGAYSKFSSYIKDWQDQLKDVIVLENLPDLNWEPYEGFLKIKGIKTPHNDLGNVSAIGIKIVLCKNKNKKKEISIGFTGDTPYSSNIGPFFRGCSLLCVHIGSIKYQEIGYNEDIYHHNRNVPRKYVEKEKQISEVVKVYNNTNHLLLFGTEWLIADFMKESENKDAVVETKNKDALVILGEFGEELKYGVRSDLCKRLKISEEVKCFPGDIGLYVTISPNNMKKIRCNFCMKFINPNKIKTFSHGREDSIQYICLSCNYTLTELQKQALIEHRLTSH